jgi:hypothetical protein
MSFMPKKKKKKKKPVLTSFTFMTVSHGLFNIVNYFDETTMNVLTIWP